jgi:hypothetical protein
MRRLLIIACFLLMTAAKDGPSRAPEKGCAWEKFSDASLGLEAWVQRCDFGYRRIDFIRRDNSLAVRYSDGGQPDPLIDVFDLNEGETSEAGVKRIFLANTDKKLAKRCKLAPFTGDPKPPAGVKRLTFVPDAAYEKELRKQEDPNEVGDPPCGDWGDAPDGIQYFEVQPASGARRILFVRVGQDTPLFDELTLRIR